MSTPISGGGPSTPPVPGSGSSTPPVSPSVSQYIQDLVQQDTTSVAPGVSLLAFTQAISKAVIRSHDIAWESQQLNQTRRNDFYRALIGEAAAFIEFYHAVLGGISTQLIPINDANTANVNTLNSALDTYNTTVVPADQAAIDAVNTAIEQYNAGTITTAQYNTAVATYNAYVASRNGSATVTDTSNALSDFNTATASINIQIADFNATYLDFPDAPTVSGQTPYGTSTAPSLSNADTSPPAVQGSTSTIAPSTTLTSTSNTISPTPSELQDTANALLSVLTGSTSQNAKLYAIQGHYISYIQFILQNDNITLPPAFTTPTPDIDSGRSSTVSGGSADLSSLIIPSSNPLMSRLIQQANFIKDSDKAELVDVNLFPSLLLFASVTILGKMGLLVGASVYNQLIGKLSPTQAPASSLLIGQTYANEIASSVANGTLKTLTTDLLSKTFPNVPASSLTDLSNRLANVAELSHLSTATLLLSQSLGTPSLFAQLLATLPESGKLRLLNVQPPFSSTFENTAHVTRLQQALTSFLTSTQGVETQHAQAIANRAIADAVHGKALNDENTFLQSLQASFAAQGFTGPAALAAAQFSASYAQSEVIGSQVLDTDITQNSLQGTLANVLTQNILNSHNGIVSGRVLRDELAAAFVTQGTPPDVALLAATRAVVGNNASIPSLTVDELRTQLHQRVLDLTKNLDVAQSNLLADQIVTQVLGGNQATDTVSLRAQIGDVLKNLYAVQDRDFRDKVDDALRSYLNPDMSITAYAQRLRDPANTYLLSAQASGDMYARPEPTNYLKNISIHV